MSVIIDKSTRVKQAKQQYIVDATIRLMTKVGIENIRMEDIALASGYTKRTLYSYFQSKDEIFLWAYTDDLSKRHEYQKEQLKSAKTGLDKLNIWAHSLYAFCNANAHSIQIQKYMDYQFVQIDKVHESIFTRFETINNELAEGLRNIFKSGMADGFFRKELEIDITISQFLYAYRAILNRAFSGSYSFAQFDKQEYINHFLTLFILSIKTI